MNKLVIIGANSAIAANFIHRHHQDFSIVAVARSFSTAKKLADVTYIENDYSDFGPLKETIREYQNILYCVGVTNADDATIKSVNEGVFERLLCTIQDIDFKMAFISSAAILFNSGAYVDSKLFAEDALEKSGKAFISLRPSVMHGPFDQNNLVKMERFARKLPFIPVIGPRYLIQPVYMPDIVDTLAKVFASAKFTNKRYTVSGPAQVTLEHVFSLLKRKLQTRKPMIKIPLWPVQVVVRFLALFLPKNLIMAHQILNMKIHRPFDSSEFIADYGFAPQSFEDSLFRYGTCAE